MTNLFWEACFVSTEMLRSA